MSRRQEAVELGAARNGALYSAIGVGGWLLCVLVLTAAAGAQTQAGCQRPATIRVRTGTSFAALDSARLGHWYLERQMFACAVSAFSAANKGEPMNASYLYFLGLSLEREGKAEASLQPLQEAERRDPKSAAARVARGEALDELKRRPEAEAEWRAALAIDSSSGEALDQLSNDLLQDKDFLGVVSLLGEGRDRDSLSQTQTLNLGEALGLLVRMKEAIAVLEGGLQRYPGSAALADELATVQVLAGQQEQAYEILKKAMAEHPGDRPTETLYLRTLISGHSKDADGWAEKLIAEHPQDGEILYLGADLARNEGNSGRALELIERSLAANADDYKAQDLYAGLLIERGDFKGAQEHLEKAIALGDPDSDVRYQLFRVQTRLGDTVEAQKNLQAYTSRRATDKGRIDTAVDVDRGDQAMRELDAASAASFYRQALQLAPNEALIHYKLSRALDQLHDTADELDELQRAIELDPNFAEALNQMGYLSLHGGDSPKAEQFFLAATKASPSYVVAWTNLAVAYASEAKWQQAEDATDHALRLDPGNSVAARLKASIANSRSTP
jgi:tetratricopeptide (TPR) repeat protein